MDFIVSDGLPIAYTAAGEGPPVVLVHGFASTHAVNWVDTGWEAALVAAGRRVVMLDLRGHGESGRPHDAEAYSPAAMAGDVLRLMDHLAIPRADLMGYSMGAMVALYLAMRAGQRFSSVIAAGVGGAFLGEPSDPGPIVEALTADDPAQITDPAARAYRRFADANGQDLRALAPCYERVRTPLTEEGLAGIEVPVLIVAGDRDTTAGDPQALAAAIPGARAAVVPRRDHMRTVGDPVYKQIVLDFLS